MRLNRHVEVEEQEVQEQGIEGCSLPKKLQDKENLKKLIQSDLKGLSDAEMTVMKANQINLTDPDSRLMISKPKTRTDFQFNAQAVVDHKYLPLPSIKKPIMMRVSRHWKFVYF